MPSARMMFPGGNTGLGFFSYYHYITPDDARHKYIIKGGPGVGKSSLMKTLGERCLQAGLEVEYHWCSSDNNSLDGIALPQYQVAVIDGTAPHVVDPRYPGAVDEIVNLGEQWDREVLVASRQSIINNTREIGLLFNRAYSQLTRAATMYNEIDLMMAAKVNESKLHSITRQLASLLDKEPSAMPFTNSFQVRHIFASAITPEGTVSYLSSLLSPGTQVYTLHGAAGSGGDVIMHSIGHQAELAGYIVEYYHCPLFPQKIETIYLPQHSLALVNISRHIIEVLPSELASFKCQKIELNQHLAPYVNYEEVAEVQERVHAAIGTAVALIKQAKQLHDELEVHYVAAMDFPAVDRVRDQLFDDLMSWCRD
ncbi:MAG: hypothetical protein ACM3NT_09530 [Methylocystaceae bacterium]